MNLFELFVKIGVDDNGFKKGINGAKDNFGKFSAWTVAKGQLIADGIKAGGKALIDFGKQAINSYAEYEQLVGGVETLFKDSAGKVQEYAANAYKTAGVSANEYMSTVTSFSASLLQSLGGDTEAAAKYADTAVTDMADNANKMGTSIEMLQNAYSGFAKQNFTMLDNLKLGYGGTKQEMERLLEDASKISGIEYDISSFADITAAIHVMQEEMGIAGATALEANTTIEGSLNSMKGAWQNLITGLADDSADFDTLINNMVESAGTFAGNLLPRIEVALGGIATLIEKLAPIIVEKIPSLVDTILPTLISAAISLVNSVAAVLPSLLETLITALLNSAPMLIDAVINLVNVIVNMLPSLLPKLINGVISLVVSLAKNFKKIIDPLIKALPKIIVSVVEALVENLPDLIDGIIELTMGIIEAIPEIIQSLVDAIPTIISLLIEALLGNLPAIISGLLKVTMGILTALPQILGSLIEGAVNVFKGLWDGLKNVFSGLGNWFKDKFTEGKEAAAEAWSDAKEKFGKVWDNTKQAFSKVGSWFGETFKKGKESATGAWDNAKDTFSDIWSGIKNIFSKGADIGKNIIEGIKNGIKSAWNNLKEWFSSLFDDLIGIAKKILGIKSPSRVFKSIGKFVDEGLQIGLEEGADAVFDTVSDISDGVINSFDADLVPDYGIATSSTSINDFGGGSSVYGYSGSQNVNVTVGIDENANAMGLARALLPFLKIAEKEVYA